MSERGDYVCEYEEQLRSRAPSKSPPASPSDQSWSLEAMEEQLRSQAASPTPPASPPVQPRSLPTRSPTPHPRGSLAASPSLSAYDRNKVMVRIRDTSNGPMRGLGDDETITRAYERLVRTGQQRQFQCLPMRDVQRIEPHDIQFELSLLSGSLVKAQFDELKTALDELHMHRVFISGVPYDDNINSLVPNNNERIIINQRLLEQLPRGWKLLHNCVSNAPGLFAGGRLTYAGIETLYKHCLLINLRLQGFDDVINEEESLLVWTLIQSSINARRHPRSNMMFNPTGVALAPEFDFVSGLHMPHGRDGEPLQPQFLVLANADFRYFVRGSAPNLEFLPGTPVAVFSKQGLTMPEIPSYLCELNRFIDLSALRGVIIHTASDWVQTVNRVTAKYALHCPLLMKNIFDIQPAVLFSLTKLYIGETPPLSGARVLSVKMKDCITYYNLD